MFKKRVILILMVTFSLSNLPAQETKNAAIYYLKALDLLKFPERGTEIDKKIREVIGKGWKNECAK